MTGTDVLLAIFLLVPQSALDPSNSYLEKMYRAGCHLNSGYWESASPLSDNPDYTGAPRCTAKER